MMVTNCKGCGVPFDLATARQERLLLSREGKPVLNKGQAAIAQVSPICPGCGNRGTGRQWYAVDNGLVTDQVVPPAFLGAIKPPKIGLILEEAAPAGKSKSKRKRRK